MDTIRKSELLIKSNPWTQIYCLAGICDLTSKNKVSHIVSIRNHNSDHLVRDYCSTLHQAHLRIIQLSPLADKLKCIFCPIPGLNFATYNKRHHPEDAENQGILNEAIVKLNAEVVNFNKLHNNFTPWISRSVHRRHRQTFTNYYDKLASDGCHLSPRLRQHWAETLHEAVVNNS